MASLTDAGERDLLDIDVRSLQHAEASVC